MKKILLLFVISIFIFACGGSDGGNPPTPEQEKIFTDTMEDIGQMISASIMPCLEGGAKTCDCPGGGSVTGDLKDDIAEVDFEDCVSDGELTYSGSVDFNTKTDRASASLTEFGECTNVTASNFNPEDCVGTISGNCGGTFTCTLNGIGTEECGCE